MTVALAAFREAKTTEAAHSYYYVNSFTFESTGSTVEDVYDTQSTAARTGAGVYTVTFPSDKRPSAMRWAGVNVQTDGYSGQASYNATTGVLTIKTWTGAGAAADPTDEHFVQVHCLFVK